MAYDYGATSLYSGALGRSQQRYEQMIKELRKAEGVSAELAPEFQQVVDIYRTGGEYGVGAKAAIEKAARYGTSSAMANLIRTGMSAGTIAEGVRARYGRQATEQIQSVEDIRYEKLSAALQALASAKEARGLKATQTYQTTAGLISSFREPTMGEFVNPEAIARGEIMAANWRALLGAKTEEERIKATQKLATQQQAFTAEQAKIYEPTAAQKTSLYRYL